MEKNITVTFQAKDSFNVETPEEAVEQCKRDNGRDIEIISVED